MEKSLQALADSVSSRLRDAEQRLAQPDLASLDNLLKDLDTCVADMQQLREACSADRQDEQPALRDRLEALRGQLSRVMALVSSGERLIGEALAARGMTASYGREGEMRTASSSVQWQG